MIRIIDVWCPFPVAACLSALPTADDDRQKALWAASRRALTRARRTAGRLADCGKRIGVTGSVAQPVQDGVWHG